MKKNNDFLCPKKNLVFVRIVFVRLGEGVGLKLNLRLILSEVGGGGGGGVNG